MRSARARSRRSALRRPDGRTVEVALGRALVGVLAERGAVTADGRLAGGTLRAHPDLLRAVNAATVALGDEYAADEVQEVLQARLAALSTIAPPFSHTTLVAESVGG